MARTKQGKTKSIGISIGLPVWMFTKLANMNDGDVQGNIREILEKNL